jgi:hypothetical protein
MPKKAGRTIRDNVETILRCYPDTRNDDKLLLLYYWAIIDGIEFGEEFESQFKVQATMPESITRARRLIQEEGLFLPTTAVAIGRRNKEVQMRYSVTHNREVVE